MKEKSAATPRTGGVCVAVGVRPNEEFTYIAQGVTRSVRGPAKNDKKKESRPVGPKREQGQTGSKGDWSLAPKVDC